MYSLNDTTLKILKNFSAISESILMRPGTTQKTMSASKSIMATAELPVEWPQETGIYQLPQFLSNLSAYEKPTLTFEPKQFVIKGSNSPSHVEYPYADPTVIASVPEKTLPIDNARAEFVLSAVALAEIKKLAAINSLPSISIDLNPAAKTIVVKPQDEKNSGSRTYSYPVHSDAKAVLSLADDDAFSALLKTEFFNLLMDGGYMVHVGNWPYVFFKHQTEPVSYYIVRTMNTNKKN